jgi:hypothetical protein
MAQLGEVEGRAGLALAMSSISPNHTPVGSGGRQPKLRTGCPAVQRGNGPHGPPEGVAS